MVLWSASGRAPAKAHCFEFSASWPAQAARRHGEHVAAHDVGQPVAQAQRDLLRGVRGRRLPRPPRLGAALEAAQRTLDRIVVERHGAQPPQHLQQREHAVAEGGPGRPVEVVGDQRDVVLLGDGGQRAARGQRQPHPRPAELRREGRDDLLGVPGERAGDQQRSLADRRRGVVAHDLGRYRAEMLGDGGDDVAADRGAAHPEDHDAPGAGEVLGQRAVAAQRARGARLSRQVGDQPPEAARVEAIAHGGLVEHAPSLPRPVSSRCPAPRHPTLFALRPRRYKAR